ncbi:MAG: ABC transporter permease [Microthrixaceae bacterium]|nr:ABC transporter permease [Microthrixaceae bacterium]
MPDEIALDDILETLDVESVPTGPDSDSRLRPIDVAAPVVTAVIAVGIWALVTMVFAGPTSHYRPFNPVDTAKALARLFGEGAIWLDIRVSLARLGAGLAIAAAIGISVGCLTGSVRIIDKATTPLFQFIRMISPVAWTPVAIVLMGVGSAPAITLIALTAVWPLILNTSAGVRAIPHGWLALARSLGATRFEAFTSIIAPAIRLPVLTGLRVALGVGWIVLVPVEMLGSSEGLGYAIVNAKDALAYDELLATIVIVGALGFVLDSVLRFLIHRVTPPGTHNR